MRKEIKKPPRYAHCISIVDTNSMAYALATVENIEFVEQSKDASQWVVAMNEEMQSILKNNTWNLVLLPRGAKLVGCKWVFKTKEDISRVELARFEARLVAKGFSQKERIDFYKLFSPVVKYMTISVILNMVSALDLDLEQLNVKIAFLHVDLEEQIYIS